MNWPKSTSPRQQQLVKQGVIARTEFDNAQRQQKSTEAKVGEIQATIDRKTIRAPFTGILGLRQINLGQYLAAGAGDRSSASGESDLRQLRSSAAEHGVRCKVGRFLKVTSDDLPGVTFTGRVTAIDSVVDQATRNIQVQATLTNPGNRLRPGMFVQVQVSLGAEPRRHRPAGVGDQLRAVRRLGLCGRRHARPEDGKTYRGVRQQFVKVEGSRGDQVGGRLGH